MRRSSLRAPSCTSALVDAIQRVGRAGRETGLPLPPSHSIQSTTRSSRPSFGAKIFSQRLHNGGDNYLDARRPRHITLGALQKRLGVMRALAIENSTAPKCVALRGFLNRFKYADLDDPDLPLLLGMLAAAGLPEADAEFPGSEPVTVDLINAVIREPVQPEERP